jgi:hypothetical protein
LKYRQKLAGSAVAPDTWPLGRADITGGLDTACPTSDCQTISILFARPDGAAIVSCALNGGPNMTTWQKPEFIEVSMNAEIGSYQEDFGGRGNAPPIVPARTQVETHDKAR